MAKNFIDGVAQELMRVIGPGINLVLETATQQSDNILLRKFKQNYDKLTLEEIQAVEQVLGHSDSENAPCYVCRIIARKEWELNED